MQLTIDERETLHQFGEYAEDWLSSRGFAVHIDHDFKKFSNYLDYLRFDDYEHRNPMFEAKTNTLSRDASHYLLIEEAGKPVAIVAGRMREIPSLSDILINGHFFFEQGPPADFHWKLLTSDFPTVSGQIAIGGNIFITPRLRRRFAPPHKQGLFTCLRLLQRAALLRNFNPDWYVAVIRSGFCLPSSKDPLYQSNRFLRPWLRALDGDLYGLAQRPRETLINLEKFLSLRKS